MSTSVTRFVLYADLHFSAVIIAFISSAAAWALSEWYVKFPQAVGQLLAQQTLEPWVQNKAIQKVRESRRVSKAEKDALLRYKL